MIHRVRCDKYSVFGVLWNSRTLQEECIVLAQIIKVSTFSTCRAAQRLELKGVQAYNNLDGLQGLHTLPTAIVDYRGVRLSAQGLAPGLEGSEQDQETTPASR